MVAKIENGKTYKVELAKSVRIGRLIVSPGPNTRLSGEALKALVDQDNSAVKHYEAV